MTLGNRLLVVTGKLFKVVGSTWETDVIVCPDVETIPSVFVWPRASTYTLHTPAKKSVNILTGKETNRRNMDTEQYLCWDHCVANKPRRLDKHNNLYKSIHQWLSDLPLI